MKILAMVLAGGNGTRLHPLTARQAKPALMFAGGYRIVDFVLANLVNSGTHPIYVLAQYKPRSLVEHIRAAWAPWSAGTDAAIQVVLPETGGVITPFLGTADAIYQNLHLSERHAPDLVAVFAADHIYRMDVRQMASFHRQCGAGVTIAAARVPIAQASAYGIMTAGPGGELLDFQEKPGAPSPIPASPGHAYASMGNYLFNPDVLVELLEEAHVNGGTDFGRHIMPLLPRRKCAWAYDFSTNEVPGMRPYEERGYWRDIGTIEAYRSAQREVLGPKPRFNLMNSEWPIRRREPPVNQTSRPPRLEPEVVRLLPSRPFDPFVTPGGIAHSAGVSVIRTRLAAAHPK